MHIEITETEYDFLKILTSVLLGMFGKSLFDYLKKIIENKKKRNFVSEYLKSAEIVFPLLRDEYNKVKKYIMVDVFDNKKESLPVKLFEDFNSEILSSITFPEYFKLFNKKALIIFDIYHMTNTIKKDLPYEIVLRHQDFTRKILSKTEKNENKIDKTDLIYKKYKSNVENSVMLIDMKINEINIVRKKIQQFLK